MILNKKIRIAVIACNDIEDMEFIIPIDIWRRAKFIVDVVACEVKNTFNLNYSSLKVSAIFNINHTNLIQYDAIFLPGGPGYKRFLNPISNDKTQGESKLHSFIKKFYTDEDKWLIGICASPIAIACILDMNQDTMFNFTSYPDDQLIGDFKSKWVDKNVVIDNKVITAKCAGNSFDLAFTVIERLTSLEYAQEIAKSLNIEFKGYQSF